MNLQKIEAVLKAEPAFRVKQINKLIYQDLIDDWRKGTTLPLGLRDILGKEIPLTINAQNFVSKDGKTVKALITLDDGLKIETVLMGSGERNSVCVSSQVGCPLGCLFCATGKMGFKRNLTPQEIVNQVIYFARLLKKENRKVTNVVYMGMGEPFLNYDNVIESIKILNDPDKFNLGSRHISVSTAGIIEGIDKFSAEDFEVNLAISLHAPNDQIRKNLMPIDSQYPLEKVMVSVKEYVKKNRRKVMFEYILLDGINDSAENAIELARLLAGPLVHLNLIQYNETEMFKGSTSENIIRFKEILSQKGVSFTERFRFGTDINAACGQLATKNQ